MSVREIVEGGCLCGAVRYQVIPPLPPGGHCHCAMCRKSSGAVALTWVSVPRDRFRIVKGRPAVYRSSRHAERSFCSACGSPLTFYSSRSPEDIDITLGTLDNPEQHPPDRHVFAAARLGWLQLDADLPHYEEWTPPDHGAPESPD